MGKITLESCSYDFNKDLLKVCTRLTQYPDFFSTGLRFMQYYNQMGGMFSYGNEYYNFCSELICNNLELFSTGDKLKKYLQSDLPLYKNFGALIVGISLYEEYIGSNSTMNQYAIAKYQIYVHYIRKNAENNASVSVYADLDYNLNSLEYIRILMTDSSKKITQDAYLLGEIFSKTYLCQDVEYNFLDGACILGALVAKGYDYNDAANFLSTICDDGYIGGRDLEDRFENIDMITQQETLTQYFDSLSQDESDKLMGIHHSKP